MCVFHDDCVTTNHTTNTPSVTQFSFKFSLIFLKHSGGDNPRTEKRTLSQTGENDRGVTRALIHDVNTHEAVLFYFESPCLSQTPPSYSQMSDVIWALLNRVSQYYPYLNT